MPILAGLLTSLFSGIAGFFATWLTKKAALGAAAVSVFAGLTIGIYVAVGALLMGVVAFLPDSPGLLTGVWVAVPDNAQGLVSIAIAADTAIALYRWNVENLRLLAYIT